MDKSKELIGELTNIAATTLVELDLKINTVADNSHAYDVRIDLNNSKTANSPHYVSLSYVNEGGYFIDIENETFEFQEDGEAFKSESIKYFGALKSGKLVIVNKKLFKVFSVGSGVKIID